MIRSKIDGSFGRHLLSRDTLFSARAQAPPVSAQNDPGDEVYEWILLARKGFVNGNK